MSITYNPEQYGCSIVGELEAGGGYDFDTVLVVKSDYNGLPLTEKLDFLNKVRAVLHG